MWGSASRTSLMKVAAGMAPLIASVPVVVAVSLWRSWAV